MNIYGRLDKYTDKTPGYGPFGDCWRWTAAKDHFGYGTLKVEGRTKKAHRLSYARGRGEIPAAINGKAVCVLHRCDNPGCVRLGHLFIGTRAVNMHDMDLKGRRAAAKGINNGNVKLNETNVFAIRQDTRLGYIIADEYGISATQISRIKTRKAWTHLL